MRVAWKFATFVLPILVLASGRASAQQRALLYELNASPELKAVAAKLCDPKTEKILYPNLTRETDYFARLVSRKDILNPDNTLKDGAILGIKAMVFISNTQSVEGRSLLELFQGIGYEAEEILGKNRNKDMVLVVFRYANDVSPSNVKVGCLPDDYLQHIYTPTWDNIFALLDRMAEKAPIEPNRKGEIAPDRTFFRSNAERNFVLSFPSEGRERVKSASYYELRAIRGSDWVYRQMLESKLSVTEHFLGTGRTHDEVMDPEVRDREAGLIEFVGPNRKIQDLAEVAVVHIGKLSVEDTYSLKRPAP